MALLSTMMIAAAGAAAQPAQAAPAAPALWQPTARYVDPGQDEPGYRAWYMAAPWRPVAVKSFNDYLSSWGVSGVVPTWQLLRTASDWRRCGEAAFELPPTSEWPNIVQTLRYVRDRVVPAVGPVEAVSVYRNQALNACAGGAAQSAHRYTQAIDLVPLRPTTRDRLISDLCKVHAESGAPYGVGLGFYAYLRFHVDSRRFRKWGFAGSPGAAACIADAAAAAAPVAPAHPPAETLTPAPQ